MVLSLFLAKVLGWWLVLTTLSFLLNKTQFKKIIEQFARNEALIYTTGIFTTVVGLLIIISHNIWEPNWRGLITLVGWLILFKGSIRMFFPQKIAKISKKTIDQPWVTFSCVIFLFL